MDRCKSSLWQRRLVVTQTRTDRNETESMSVGELTAEGTEARKRMHYWVLRNDERFEMEKAKARRNRAKRVNECGCWVVNECECDGLNEWVWLYNETEMKRVWIRRSVQPEQR